MALDCDNEYNGIARDCTGSLGGLTAAYATSRNNITGFTFDTTNDCLITAITMAEGELFKKYGIQPDTSNFTTTASYDATTGSTPFTTTLTLVFAKMTGEKNCELQKFASGDSVWIVKERNRRYWLLGVDAPDDDIAMELADGTQAETGTVSTDLNGYTLVLVHNTYHYAYEVTEEVYLQVTGQATSAPASFPLNTKSDTVGTVSDSNVDGMVAPGEVAKTTKTAKQTVNKTA